MGQTPSCSRTRGSMPPVQPRAAEHAAGSSSAHKPSSNIFLLETCREQQEHVGVHLRGLIPQTDAPALCHCHPQMITGCGRWFPSVGKRQEFIPAPSSFPKRRHLHTSQGTEPLARAMGANLPLGGAIYLSWFWCTCAGIPQRVQEELYWQEGDGF